MSSMEWKRDGFFRLSCRRPPLPRTRCARSARRSRAARGCRASPAGRSRYRRCRGTTTARAARPAPRSCAVPPRAISSTNSSRDLDELLPKTIPAPVAGEGVILQQEDHRIDVDQFEARRQQERQVDAGAGAVLHDHRRRAQPLRVHRGAVARRRVDVAEVELVDDRRPDRLRLAIDLAGRVGGAKVEALVAVEAGRRIVPERRARSAARSR